MSHHFSDREDPMEYPRHSEYHRFAESHSEADPHLYDDRFIDEDHHEYVDLDVRKASHEVEKSQP